MPDFHDVLKRLDSGFTVALIAQPVEVSGHDVPLDHVVARASEKKFDTAFIGRRRSGGTSVWVDKVVDVQTKTDRDVLASDLVSDSTPLSAAIGLLAERRFALVLTGDRVTAVVTRADLNLLPVRVMLFTVMTHAEMLLADAISREYRGDTWISALSASQQARIEELQQEKIKQDADTRLLDCASLGQKCDVASRTPALRKLLGCPSKSKFDGERRTFVRLRNRLLHNQQLVLGRDGRAPEDTLRDALAHGDRLIVTADAARTLRDVLGILQRWIDAMNHS
jgi:hypothetical protein